jgi:hypothetical protein
MVTPIPRVALLQHVSKSTPRRASQRAASRFWFDPHDASAFNSITAASASPNSFEFLQTDVAGE